MLQQTSIMPDIISYSAAISACDNGRQWQQASALGLLAVMQQTAVLPTVTSYIAALSACDICRQGQQALGVLAGMQLMLFRPMSCPAVPPSVLVGRR